MRRTHKSKRFSNRLRIDKIMNSPPPPPVLGPNLVYTPVCKNREKIDLEVCSGGGGKDGKKCQVIAGFTPPRIRFRKTLGWAIYGSKFLRMHNFTPPPREKFFGHERTWYGDPNSWIERYRNLNGMKFGICTLRRFRK